METSLYKRNIHRLTQTYLTLSLQDIAETVQLEGPKEAELHVLRMVALLHSCHSKHVFWLLRNGFLVAYGGSRIFLQIQDGDIFATINQKDGMVSFQEDPEQYNTQQMTEKLDSQIHQ